ncbi:MAG: hypothetical protein ACMG6E_08895, partial [Candidatus Roizmanbacteria bacterium]
MLSKLIEKSRKGDQAYDFTRQILVPKNELSSASVKVTEAGYQVIFFSSDQVLGFTFDDYVELLKQREARDEEPLLFLADPSVVTYFTVGDLKIYLFGEIHEREVKCQNAINYPEYLVKVLEAQPEVLVDVFHEFPYDLGTSESEGERQLYFDSIKRLFATGVKFEECFKTNKTNCKYNARFHYVDIRNLPDISFLVKSYFKLIEDPERADEIIAEMSEVIAKDIDWLRASKAMKQFEAIADPRLRETIIAYWSKIVANNVTTLYENYRNPAYLKNLLFKLHVSLVDAYTVGRMLRSYQKGPPAKNIIGYFGYVHTQNITKFFRKVFNVSNVNEIGEYSSLPACLFLYNDDLIPPLFNSPGYVERQIEIDRVSLTYFLAKDWEDEPHYL